jgi:hypothetical protein
MDTPSRSLTTNINGSSRNGNVTSVDGAAIQQVYLPHHTLYNPPTENIQSVDVVTNAFTAEQGLAGGAVVSVLTKSGTNAFHGTLWEENTNSALAARNYFYNKTYLSQVSDFNRTNVFDAGFTAELPFGKDHAFLNSPGMVSAIAGGWKINGVVSKYSGLPFTPIASATSLNAPFNTQVANKVKSSVAYPKGIGKFATWFDTSAFAPVTTASFGTASRNSLRGPGAADLDLGISRLFPITDRFHFELRAEAFNATNTPNFAVPANDASSSNFGQITSTFGSAADSRLLRFTGKLSF